MYQHEQKMQVFRLRQARSEMDPEWVLGKLVNYLMLDETCLTR
jgi:hypothetical protein